MTSNLEYAEKLARRAAVLAVAVATPLAASVLMASPAGAEVPENWSDPDPVSPLHALLVLGGIPLALFVLITLAILVPSLIRGEGIKPGQPALENQWLGGPRKTTAELAGPDSEESEAGGASARW